MFWRFGAVLAALVMGTACRIAVYLLGAGRHCFGLALTHLLA